MRITFKTKHLKKCANNERYALKSLGKIRAKRLKIRLDDLYGAISLEDVRHLPGRYHELSEDRKGQWACDLDHPYRLIFKPHEYPVPTNETGRYVWMEIVGIEIIEIADYH
jgi:proteic killer suppression protein